jgi:uncharacterized protein
VLLINQDQYPGELALHQKYAKSDVLLNLVWTHCNIVADIAVSILDSGILPNPEEIPRDILIQACLLYDIGVYACGGFEHLPGQPPSDKPYIQHTIVGAWILKQEGYLPQVIEAAHVHTGVGLTSQDIQTYGLQLPPQDYIPLTTFHRLITYACKFHSKAPKFRTAEEILASLERHGEDKVHIFLEMQAQFGPPNLQPIQDKYKEWHLSFTYQMSQLNQGTKNGLTLSPAGISQ